MFLSDLSIKRPVFATVLMLALLTLGLFTFVINAFVLWLTSALSGRLGLGFHVAGFGSAFLGALVVSIVSFLLSVVAPDPERA